MRPQAIHAVSSRPIKCTPAGTIDLMDIVVPVCATIAAAITATSSSSEAAPAGSTEVTAPMPGKVLRVLAKVGDTVSANDNLLILEAMKMENEIPAGRDGKVLEIRVSEGSAVNSGDVLVVIG